jgi:hypothetical protein
MGDWMKLFFILLASGAALSAQPSVNVQEIVRKSVEATDRNWKEAPNYVYTLREVEEKLDSHGRVKSRTVNTWEVSVLEGSEYKKLLRRDGKPLSKEEEEAEERKYEAEKLRREHESPSERAKRIAKYQRERKQDHAMMHEMANAFAFKLVGEETVDGHRCYVLDATPKPGYAPHSRETKVLTGMRGKMWIDKETFQWVKVEADVIHPVSFYAVATVGPGTKFVLEQTPVGDGIWQPKRFAVRVNASVFWISRNSSEEDVYTNYRRANGEAARVAEQRSAHAGSR